MNDTSSTPATTTATTTAPRGMLAAAVALGAAQSLWSVFQWVELVLARKGQTPFCSINETFNCAQVWDSSFAVRIHDVTLVPVAGWGLVWGLVATVLPLAALAREDELARGLSSALRFTALSGVATLCALVTASALAGAVCIGCIGTYVLVGAWSFLAWRSSSSSGWANPIVGGAGAFALVVVGYLGVVYPGAKTPHAGRDVLQIPVAGDGSSSSSPSSSPAAPAAPGRFNGPPTGDAARDELLQRFVDSLDGDGKQILADLLAETEGKQPVAQGPARAFSIGTGREPLRITEWTDARCPHCAQLHMAMAEIQKAVPPGVFSVEPRHFPLDGNCNAGMQRKSADGIRCLAAKAEICLEGNAKLDEATGKIFETEQLTAQTLSAVLAPYIDGKKLQACMDAPETSKKLDDDVNAAIALHIEGTPLVLMNGREVRGWPPLVYALVLNGGSTKHPAFATLPSPRPLPAPGEQAH